MRTVYRAGRYRVQFRQDRGTYVVAWWDEQRRGDRRRTIGAGDLEAAKSQADAWHSEDVRRANREARGGPREPHEVTVAEATLNYIEDVCDAKPKRERSHCYDDVNVLIEWFGDWRISDCTKQAVARRLRELQAHRQISVNGRQAYATRLKSALRNEWREGRVASFPFFDSTKVQSKGEHAIPAGDLARIMDRALDWPHLFRALVFCLNTAARREAITDFTADQIQWQSRDPELACDLLDLNPDGRETTAKGRAVLPVTDTLRPWLLAMDKPHFVHLHGRPIKTFNTVQRTLKAEGLHSGRLFYGVRHSVARAMRRRNVPMDQISGWLGHAKGGVTEIYATWQPEYATEAREAVEDFVRSVAGQCERADLLSPHGGEGQKVVPIRGKKSSTA
jgi:integrase